MIKIGDKFFNTEAFGDVEVVDIYISPTTQERVYKVKEIFELPLRPDFVQEFLCHGVELTS